MNGGGPPCRSPWSECPNSYRTEPVRSVLPMTPHAIQEYRPRRLRRRVHPCIRHQPVPYERWHSHAAWSSPRFPRRWPVATLARTDPPGRASGTDRFLQPLALHLPDQWHPAVLDVSVDYRTADRGG